MDKLPQELLDEVFHYIWDTEMPITERFATCSKSSRRTTLSCRLVARRWFESDCLTSTFVGVITEIPFVWYNHRLPVLEEITEIPRYARWFNPYLTICGMDLALVTLGDHDRWGPGRDELDKKNPIAQYLTHLLRRTSWVEHVQYYPIHPNCLDGTWPKWQVSESDRCSFETCFPSSRGRSNYGYPALAEGQYSWHGIQMESEWIFSKIMEGLAEPHIWLESFESPLLGNRASYCAISGGGDLSRTHGRTGRDLFSWFPRTLKRVAITTTHHRRGPFLNFDGLERLENLEYLDITLSKSPQRSMPGYGPFGVPFSFGPLFPPAWYQLEKLKEFRLMVDHQYSFWEHDILSALNFFPNLERFAFGHILLGRYSGFWSNLLQRLAALNLNELWLLNPRDLVFHDTMNPPDPNYPHHHSSQTSVPIIDGTHNTDYHMVKYVEDHHLLAAAQKVRLIETGSMWTDEGYAYPGLSRDFEYPGFAIFEQTEGDG